MSKNLKNPVRVVIDYDSDDETNILCSSINDKMKSIITAKTLTLDELRETTYLTNSESVEQDNINVGDYVYFYKSRTGAWGKPTIGRVSRRTTKTIWINEIKANLNNKIRYCNDNRYFDVTHEIHYYNISERINIESTETKTTANNSNLYKITNNFTTWNTVDYSR